MDPWDLSSKASVNDIINEFVKCNQKFTSPESPDMNFPGLEPLIEKLLSLASEVDDIPEVLTSILGDEARPLRAFGQVPEIAEDASISKKIHFLYLLKNANGIYSSNSSEFSDRKLQTLWGDGLADNYNNFFARLVFSSQEEINHFLNGFCNQRHPDEIPAGERDDFAWRKRIRKLLPYIWAYPLVNLRDHITGFSKGKADFFKAVLEHEDATGCFDYKKDEKSLLYKIFSNNKQKVDFYNWLFETIPDSLESLQHLPAEELYSESKGLSLVAFIIKHDMAKAFKMVMKNPAFDMQRPCRGELSIDQYTHLLKRNAIGVYLYTQIEDHDRCTNIDLSSSKIGLKNAKAYNVKLEANSQDPVSLAIIEIYKKTIDEYIANNKLILLVNSLQLAFKSEAEYVSNDELLNFIEFHMAECLSQKPPENYYFKGDWHVFAAHNVKDMAKRLAEIERSDNAESGEHEMLVYELTLALAIPGDNATIIASTVNMPSDLLKLTLRNPFVDLHTTDSEGVTAAKIIIDSGRADMLVGCNYYSNTKPCYQQLNGLQYAAKYRPLCDIFVLYEKLGYHYYTMRADFSSDRIYIRNWLSTYQESTDRLVTVKHGKDEIKIPFEQWLTQKIMQGHIPSFICDSFGFSKNQSGVQSSCTAGKKSGIYYYKLDDKVTISTQNNMVRGLLSICQESASYCPPVATASFCSAPSEDNCVPIADKGKVQYDDCKNNAWPIIRELRSLVAEIDEAEMNCTEYQHQFLNKAVAIIESHLGESRFFNNDVLALSITVNQNSGVLGYIAGGSSTFQYDTPPFKACFAQHLLDKLICPTSFLIDIKSPKGCDANYRTFINRVLVEFKSLMFAQYAVGNNLTAVDYRPKPASMMSNLF